MRGGQRLGVKPPLLERHVLADMRPDDGLGAVIQELARNPTEMTKRLAVTRPEGDQVLRASQRAERITRMTEHHVKAVQRQLQPRAGANRLLVRPVNLRLEPRRGLKPLLRPARRPRPGPVDISTDGVVAALEPIIADQVLMHPRGQQPRLRGQPLIDQRLQRIQLRRHPLAAIHRLRTGLQIPLHRPPIPADQPADLRVREPLTRKRPDVHQILLADQRRPPRSRTRSPRASRPPQTEPPTRRPFRRRARA
jgi:hypothetical protein